MRTSARAAPAIPATRIAAKTAEGFAERKKRPYRKIARDGIRDEVDATAATREVRGMKSPLAKVLLGLLLLDALLTVLVTPVGGMETRAPADSSAIGFAAVGLFSVGLLIDLAAIVQLLRKRRVAPTLAAIGTLLYFPVVITDRAGLFQPHAAPPAIRDLEWSVAAVSLVALAVALVLRARVRAEPSPG